MSLPVYVNVNFRTGQLEEVRQVLSKDMNLRHPVALNLKALELDQQREVAGLIENFFVSSNVSWKFPYPIYLVTDCDPSVTHMPVAKLTEELPKFFTQKDTKMNVKEMHLSQKNKLLQQEVKNGDASNTDHVLSSYGAYHRQVHHAETERKFYLSLYQKMIRTKNG